MAVTPGRGTCTGIVASSRFGAFYTKCLATPSVSAALQWLIPPRSSTWPSTHSDSATAPRRRTIGRLTALALAAAGAIIAVTASAQTEPDAGMAPHHTKEFYCAGAAGYGVICDPPGLMITSYTGTVTIQATNHAHGGEVCVLQNYDYEPITNTLYIDPGDNRPKTFSNKAQDGTWFWLRCMRRSPVPNSDAGIGGWIYFP